MPEITVNEYGDFGLSKNNIWFAGQILGVFAEPQTFPMKRRSNLNLQASILSLYAGHAVSALFWR
jgi:hypothetical protein